MFRRYHSICKFTSLSYLRKFHCFSTIATNTIMWLRLSVCASNLSKNWLRDENGKSTMGCRSGMGWCGLKGWGWGYHVGWLGVCGEGTRVPDVLLAGMLVIIMLCVCDAVKYSCISQWWSDYSWWRSAETGIIWLHWQVSHWTDRPWCTCQYFFMLLRHYNYVDKPK